MTFRPFAALVLLSILIPNLFASPFDNWHWRSPSPQGNPLYNIRYLNGNWIASGEFGTLLTSTNGTNWATRTTGLNLDLHGCAYGAGNYVVVGALGTILTSPDMMTWTAQYAGTFYSLNAIIFAANQFVAVGEGTVILTSPDGFNWTPRSSGDWTLNGIIYTNGLYVCVGGTNSQSVILASTNSVDWTLRLLTQVNGFSSIAYGDGEFAAALNENQFVYTAGNIWISADGANWQSTSMTQPYGPIAVYFSRNKWLLTTSDGDPVALPLGSLFVSSNLVDWSEAITNEPAISAIDSSSNSLLASRLDGTIISSMDASNWVTPNFAAIPAYPSDIEFLNGSFVSVAGNQIAFSHDGCLWTNLDTLTNSLDFLSITYGNGRYVAGAPSRNVLTSLDGLNWTNPAPQLDISPYVANVAVAFGNGIFVGASGYVGDTLTSTDGLNWSVQRLGTNAGDYVYFSDVKFGGGRFVSVGGTAVATSTNGTNWFFSNTNEFVNAVACGDGSYVAVGPFGAITSQDGTNWMPTLSTPLNGVAYGAGYFVAIGSAAQYPDYSISSQVWYSNDGQQWASASLNTPLSFSQIAYGDGTFVIIGPDNAVLQTDPFVSLSLTMNPAPAILLNGPAPATYRLDFADILLSPPQWSNFGPVTVTQTPAILDDPSHSFSQARFYRAVLLP